MRHLPLVELLNAFLGAGLRIDHVVEPREEPLQYVLALRAYRLPTPLGALRLGARRLDRQPGQ